MTAIEYEDYLDGTYWPSESKTNREDYQGTPQTIWVGDMTPQNAASALAKLLRWARGGAATEAIAEEEVHRVRRTTLARALAAKATSDDDFAFPEENTETMAPGPQMDIGELAREIVIGIAETAAEEDFNLDALGRVATSTARHMAGRGVRIYREEPIDD